MRKDTLFMLSYMPLIGLSVCYLYHILVAYFDPEKATTLYINAIGEANIEFFLIPVSIIISVIAAINLWSKIKMLNVAFSHVTMLEHDHVCLINWNKSKEVTDYLEELRKYQNKMP